MQIDNLILSNQAVNDFDLTLYDSRLSKDNLLDPIKTSSGIYLDVTQYAYGWNRKIRRIGGMWEGSFNLSTNPPAGIQPIDRAIALEIFYSKLGLHVEERVPNEGDTPTFEGYIHDVYLSTANSQRIRSYDELANRLIVVDGSCNVTDVIENEQSILRYGAIEKIVDVSQLSTTGTNITDYLTQLLRSTSWVRPNFVGRIASTSDITLQIRIRGYIFTSAFRYYINSFVDTPVSTVVNDIFTSLDYLVPGIINTNSLLITNDYCDNAMKILTMLTELGSLNNPLWVLSLNNYNRLNYDELDISKPQYYITFDGRWTNTQNSDVAVNARRITPGIVEDTMFPVFKDEPNSVFLKSNVFLAEQIGVRPNGSPEWSTNDIFDEVEDIHILSEAKQAFNTESFDLDGIEGGLNGLPNSFIGV